jgi:hypothetical protein
MSTKVLRDRQYQIPFIAIAPFLSIAFGIAWGIFALFILLPQPIVAIFGQISGQHPLFFLAIIQSSLTHNLTTHLRSSPLPVWLSGSIEKPCLEKQVPRSMSSLRLSIRRTPVIRELPQIKLIQSCAFAKSRC